MQTGETGENTAPENDPSVDVPTVPAGEDVPDHAQGTPPIGDQGAQKGKTTHPAPGDDAQADAPPRTPDP